MVEVYYQGLEGSFSHIAAKKLFNIKGSDSAGTKLRGTDKFERIYQIVEAAAIDSEIFGVVPIENTIAGSVSENIDLLLRSKVQIVSELYLPIRHYLLGRKVAPAPSTAERLAKTKKIVSHIKAIEQCQTFIGAQSGIESVMVPSTSHAARLVSESEDPSIAAIASLEAAKLYDLEILAKDIQDTQVNFTRFCVIAPQPGALRSAEAATSWPESHSQVLKAHFAKISSDAKSGPYKVSIAFNLPHVSGSLVNLLLILKQDGANLIKIESRPIIERPFEYRFLLDFTLGSSSSLILDRLPEAASNMTLLGIYPQAPISTS